MAKDARAFAAKLQKAAKTTERVNKGAVVKAAQVGKSITQSAMSSKGVTPGKKLKVGRAVNAYYTFKPGDGGSATAIVQLRGPAHLVNNATQAHGIQPRAKGRRGGRKKALKIGENVRASANHPGTKGKHFWEAAEAQMVRRIPDVIRQAHVNNWIKELGG